jgi:hypothetical protein
VGGRVEIRAERSKRIVVERDQRGLAVRHHGPRRVPARTQRMRRVMPNDTLSSNYETSRRDWPGDWRLPRKRR